MATNEMINHHKFRKVFAGKDKTKTIQVPGSITTIEQATDLIRLSMVEAIDFLCNIHSAGYSFGGKLTPDELMMTSTGNLKAIWKKWLSLEKCNEKNRKMDMSCLADIIRYCIFDRDAIPLDILDLLYLMDIFNLIC